VEKSLNVFAINAENILDLGVVTPAPELFNQSEERYLGGSSVDVACEVIANNLANYIKACWTLFINHLRHQCIKRAQSAFTLPENVGGNMCVGRRRLSRAHT
jgi:hypothetical protein